MSDLMFIAYNKLFHMYMCEKDNYIASILLENLSQWNGKT